MIQTVVQIWLYFVMLMENAAYIIAPKGVIVGMQLISGVDAPIKNGNTLPLRNIPVGSYNSLC